MIPSGGVWGCVRGYGNPHIYTEENPLVLFQFHCQSSVLDGGAEWNACYLGQYNKPLFSFETPSRGFDVLSDKDPTSVTWLLWNNALCISNIQAITSLFVHVWSLFNFYMLHCLSTSRSLHPLHSVSSPPILFSSKTLLNYSMRSGWIQIIKLIF